MKPDEKVHWLLWPLTIPYGVATWLRSAAYDHGILRQKQLRGTVICVGNLTTGGTGKTPLVEFIASRLVGEGKNVAILTRGYRVEESPDDSGAADEVQLLKAHLGGRVAFGVGANRYAQGLALEAQGVEWFVLDDGFQHRQLARDTDVLVIDGAAPFGGSQLLPAGRLRESKSALARANVIVITRSDGDPTLEREIRRYSAAPISYARTELESVLPVKGDTPLPATGPANEKWFAFCGIGNPEAFLADLQRWNFDVVGHKFYRDHHRYSALDANSIEAEARAAGADALICTEKDSFNLQRATWKTYSPWYARITLRIDRAEQFWSTLNEAIARHRGRALLRVES